MRATFAVAAHDLKLLLNERASFVVRLIIPVAFIFVIGLANGAISFGSSAPPTIDLVDNDETELSRFAVSEIGEALSSYAIGYHGTVTDRSVTDRLDRGGAIAAVVIPAGFQEGVEREEEPSIELIMARADAELTAELSAQLRLATQKVLGASRAFSAAQSLAEDPTDRSLLRAASIEADAGTMAIARIKVESSFIDLPNRLELDGFAQSVPGMGSMFVMLAVLAGSSVILEDRKRWTLQRTMIAPIRKSGYIVGKVVGRFLVGLAQYAVAIASGVAIGAIFGIDFGSSPLKMIAVMVAFVIFCSTLALLVATIVKNEQQASGLTTLIAVTLAPLGGAWWSLDMELVSEAMRQIARVSPFYWAMEGFRGAIFDQPWSFMATPLLILTALSALLLLIGSLRFRPDGS